MMMPTTCVSKRFTIMTGVMSGNVWVVKGRPVDQAHLDWEDGSSSIDCKLYDLNIDQYTMGLNLPI